MIALISANCLCHFHNGVPGDHLGPKLAPCCRFPYSYLLLARILLQTVDLMLNAQEGLVRFSACANLPKPDAPTTRAIG